MFLGVHLVVEIAELVPPVAEVAVARDARAACERPARVSPGGGEVGDPPLDAVAAQLLGDLNNLTLKVDTCLDKLGRP